MVLLYRDPYGKKRSVVAHHSRSDSKPSNGVESVKSAELEKKVASLEKTVLEGERTMTELRQRIEILTKEKNLVQVCSSFIARNCIPSCTECMTIVIIMNIL
jgi:hypothetical protein